MPTNKSMVTPTGTVNLTKDSGSDSYNVDRVNANTDKIADAITAMNSPASVSLTISTGKITAAERKFAIKLGKVVVVDLNFTVGTAITGSTDELFSGLPAPASGFRFRCFNTLNNNTPIRLSVQKVSSEGRILNAYSTGGIPAGTYEGQAVYISE